MTSESASKETNAAKKATDPSVSRDAENSDGKRTSPAGKQMDTETSPWLALIMCEGKTFERELKAFLVETQKSSNPVSSPSDDVQKRFAELTLEKPERLRYILKLLSVLFAKRDKKNGHALRRISVDLAERAVTSFLPLQQISDQSPAETFYDSVSSWQVKLGGKSIKTHDYHLLLVFIHIGHCRRWLNEEHALLLLERSCLPLAKGSLLFPESVLTASPASPKDMTALLLGVRKKREEQQKKGLDFLAAEIEKLERDKADLQNQCGKLSSEKTTAEQEVARLRQEIMDIRNAALLKDKELRGRMRELLQGRLMRLLENALEASRTEPPYVPVIQERLEDALKIMKEKRECL